MDTYEPRRKQRHNARDRQAARQRRREVMATPVDGVQSRLSRFTTFGDSEGWKARLWLILADIWWYITHKPQAMMAAVGFIGLVFGLFVLSHLLGGQIFPNVWAFGVHIGDITVEEAEAKLLTAWEEDTQIELFADGKVTVRATPAELGMALDAKQTANTARGIGMAGIPFGYAVTPVVTIDYITAQNYLLNLYDRLSVLPYNAGYEWRDGELIGVPGREGSQLDVVLTLERLTQDPVSVTMNKRLELLTSTVLPDATDPEPYLEDARQLISQPMQLVGYDPFTDQTIGWSVGQEDFARWLEAGAVSLVLRESAFIPYVDALNATLADSEVRYLDANEAMNSVQRAIVNQESSVNLRIRYRNTTYSVEPGDHGYQISRKTGIPFYMINEANPGLNWNILSVGMNISLPSRDDILPEEVVPNKRIIVNLETLTLVAYENGQQVFTWQVSSGRDEAPTSPGIYQILTHNDTAIGSGVELCGDTGCGTWEMYWFMGIYQVSPGLINGFHGAVRLPNGYLLNNGDVGDKATYGCIMSLDNDAKLLYEWAEVGTIVEIISRDFPPQSELGRQSLNVVPGGESA